jgi:hypothetical protein
MNVESSHRLLAVDSQEEASSHIYLRVLHSLTSEATAATLSTYRTGSPRFNGRQVMVVGWRPLVPSDAHESRILAEGLGLVRIV